MTNANDPSSPIQPIFDRYGDISNERFPFVGLTKREYFAAMAMQGILASRNDYATPEDVAKYSVSMADALIERLNKDQNG